MPYNNRRATQSGYPESQTQSHDRSLASSFFPLPSTSSTFAQCPSYKSELQAQRSKQILTSLPPHPRILSPPIPSPLTFSSNNTSLQLNKPLPTLRSIPHSATAVPGYIQLTALLALFALPAYATMFAPRPVQDPFQTYNTRHRDMVVQEDLQQQSKQHQQHHSEQEMGQQAPPQSDHSSHMGRRKRSFHFEPEFVAALDASLNEPRQAPPRLARMNKRMRPDVDRLLSEDAPYTASAESIGTSATKPPLRERISSQKIPDGGVSIIDLSSGEELASLQLGENKHKRRRDSTTDSSSSGESLREVFDVMEDGSLQPVLDHVPVLPSPMKRMRTHKTLDTSMNRVSRSSFEVLEEHQDHVRSVNNAQYCSHQFAGMEDYRNSQPMSMVDQDEYSGSDHTTNTSRTELGALIRYEGPKTMTLVDGVDALIRQRWSAQPELSNAQGNELVLYRRPPPTFLSSSHDHDDDNGSDDSSQPWARIEELKDDDDVSCSSQGSAIIDPSLQELEDRIMDMDLD